MISTPISTPTPRMSSAKGNMYYVNRDIIAKNANIQCYMELPSIEKVVLHSSTQKILENVNTLLDCILAILICTGQKPVCTRAKKSIARYKLRAGQLLGCKVTIRGSSNTRHSQLSNILRFLTDSVLPNIPDLKNTTHFHIGNSEPLRKLKPLFQSNDLQKKQIKKQFFQKITYSFGFPNGFIGFPQSEHLYDLFEANNGFHCNIVIRLNAKKKEHL